MSQFDVNEDHSETELFLALVKGLGVPVTREEATREWAEATSSSSTKASPTANSTAKSDSGNEGSDSDSEAASGSESDSDHVSDSDSASQSDASSSNGSTTVSASFDLAQCVPTTPGQSVRPRSGHLSSTATGSTAVDKQFLSDLIVMTRHALRVFKQK
jgi:hypothetical protein